MPGIAHALPFVNWILLISLAIGSLAFAGLAGAATEATRGYLRFTAAAAAVLAGLALLADLGLPSPDQRLVIEPADPILDSLRRASLAALALAAAAYAILAGRPARRNFAAIAGMVAAATTIFCAALGWAPTPADAVPLAVQLGLLSAVTGGALAALTLGHWYLVTPRLSVGPLVLVTRMLAIIIGLQLAVFVVWAAFGGGPGQGSFDAVIGPNALFGWLRVTVTLLFPLVLVAMAHQTARTRSMESATGLLYIAIAAIFAGTIGAAVLYVIGGLLV